ncbi:MAG: FliI/YscN family ATPase [Pseudomonadota bacterium]
MIDIASLEAELARMPLRQRCGQVIAADGGAITVTGLGTQARLGDRIRIADGPRAPGMDGEIVALSDQGVRAMIYGPVEGVALADPVWLVPDSPLRPADGWIGRVVDAFGTALDGKPLPQGDYPAELRRAPPAAATRAGLGARLATGQSVMDTVLPLVRGQRIGLFAGSGVGKSSLLTQLAQGVETDVVVFALIGERGRELGEFITNGLGPEGMKRAVLVVATSDESPLVKRRAAWTAMAVAEHFRDRGKRVLLLIDSLTRFAEAHREIALTAGETPSLRAYPPSTANLIAALAERAGPGEARDGIGDITAIFAILVAGSDMEEPVADITRGVLDGHIVLDRAIAERGRFPAIDVGRSVSRALPVAASTAENQLIADARRMVGVYEKAEPMIQTGLYRPGADAELDRAVRLRDPLDAFFAARAPEGPTESFTRLERILSEGAPASVDSGTAADSDARVKAGSNVRPVPEPGSGPQSVENG